MFVPSVASRFVLHAVARPVLAQTCPSRAGMGYARGGRSWGGVGAYKRRISAALLADSEEKNNNTHGVDGMPVDDDAELRYLHCALCHPLARYGGRRPLLAHHIGTFRVDVPTAKNALMLFMVQSPRSRRRSRYAQAATSKPDIVMSSVNGAYYIY